MNGYQYSNVTRPVKSNFTISIGTEETIFNGPNWSLGQQVLFRER